MRTVKSGGGGTTEYFTDTQLNTAAENAGVSLEQMRNMDPNQANYFVQGGVSREYFDDVPDKDIAEKAAEKLGDEWLQGVASSLGVRKAWKWWSWEKKDLMENHSAEIRNAYFDEIGLPSVYGK